ncbi:hypothetical protein HETIRDRAFT_429590 [Heterobasidion irregulare TC 32-1]|uniref:Uncharacterized protein n=1 Tax=Heterobasidion irregulare (strain TC 32-1) TaxID=747525 RepID=W4JWS9_HETIT|nr:uncharacterized protein HETIRDRAFT_429590 [Heterobasidion irregulare TC 32-1]ETW77316.1 hypothetical protein HETIRDRAFT_429590 [Heterobasidion irregulare TC 32-1]
MQLSTIPNQKSSEITVLARRFTRLYSNRPHPEEVEDENQDEDLEDLEVDKVDEVENGKTSEVLKELLASTCAVVRNAHLDPSNRDLDTIDKQADELLQGMIECAYGTHESINFLPSFAHDGFGNSLIEDLETKGVGASSPETVREFIEIMTCYTGRPLNAEAAAFPGVTREPYAQTPKPHDKTSPIARFRQDVPSSIVTEATLTAQAIYQGRCSAMSSNTCSPIGLSLSHNSTCMTLSAAGGWKNRCHVLSYYVFDNNLDDFPYEVDIETGLADMGGPLALIDNRNKILCGGRGEVEVWDVDSLPDHGPKGKKRVGKGKISINDFWHDEPEDIERLTGTDATLTIKFTDPTLDPLRWQRLSDAKILCTQRRGFLCYTIDLQTGGKVTSRYLGHGGEVNCISVSEGDPNAFLTACNDGVVRLYDVRESLPRLSFNAGAGSDPCDTALYIHVEGVPFVISSSHRLESIKV